MFWVSSCPETVTVMPTGSLVGSVLCQDRRLVARSDLRYGEKPQRGAFLLGMTFAASPGLSHPGDMVGRVDLNTQLPSRRPLFRTGESGPARIGSHVTISTDLDLPTASLTYPLIMCGRATDALSLLPTGSVQTVVTSPPYWSLRDYDVSQQIGCDDGLGEYVESIVTAFDQIRRVLTDDGTVWLNVGDSYTSGNRKYRAPDRRNRARAMSVRPPTPVGLKPKDLIGVPWRLAFALQDAGWWLRSEVIWYKPNAHPESVRDRPTKAHETVFLLSKNQDYFYDVSAVTGPNGRRLRTMWDINTEPRSRKAGGIDDHPAVMPMTLARRCIRITSRPGDVVLDPYAGSGTTLVAARELHRNWVGIELKPEYVDLIERRIATATT